MKAWWRASIAGVAVAVHGGVHPQISVPGLLELRALAEGIGLSLTGTGAGGARSQTWALWASVFPGRAGEHKL